MGFELYGSILLLTMLLYSDTRNYILDVHYQKMWCDLMWKTFKWWEIDILSYWYHVKVLIILFSEQFTWIFCDTGMKSYWCSKAVKNKDVRIMFIISFILQFHPVRHVTSFPDHITNVRVPKSLISIPQTLYDS